MGPISLGYCISKLQMPNNKKFRLSQITHFLHTIWSNEPDPPKPTPYELWCSNIMDQKEGISIIYAFLAKRSNTPSYARAWESEIELRLDPGKWFQPFRRSYKGIMNIALIEANKILTRWYYVPARLARIFTDASPVCYRGCNQVGSMFHIWWTCPHIRSFWNKFFHVVRKVTRVAVPQDSTIALLNHRVDKTPKHTQTPLFFMFLGAKITLAVA